MVKTPRTRKYKKTFAEFGQDVLGVQKIDGNDLEGSSDRIILDLLNRQQSDREPDLVILTAQKFLKPFPIILKNEKRGIKIILFFGGDAMADISFVDDFADTPEEQTTPGFFTDEVYAVSPAILDIAGERGQIFKNEFEARYGTYTGMGFLHFYYDFSKTSSLQQFQQSLTKEENTSRQTVNLQDIATIRDRVREELTQIDSPITGVAGTTRNLYFNRKRTIPSPILIGVFRQNDFVSAFTQLTPIRKSQDRFPI